MSVRRHRGAIRRLASSFGRASAAIASAISAAMAGGLSGRDIRAARAATETTLTDLGAESSRWVSENVPQIYRGAAGGGSLTAAHRQTMEELGARLTDDLTAATENMHRDARRALRELASAARSRALSGSDVGAQGARMAAEMEERGIAFVDRANRRWDARAYAMMALRTNVAIIENTAAALAASEAGAAGVRVYDGTDHDDECRQANGQSWSVAYAIAHPLSHPNCTRRFRPLAAGATGELDRQ